MRFMQTQFQNYTLVTFRSLLLITQTSLLKATYYNRNAQYTQSI
jgi:hypothetical protein